MEAEKFDEWRNNRPAERLLEIGKQKQNTELIICCF